MVCFDFLRNFFRGQNCQLVKRETLQAKAKQNIKLRLWNPATSVQFLWPLFTPPSSSAGQPELSTAMRVPGRHQLPQISDTKTGAHLGLERANQHGKDGLAWHTREPDTIIIAHGLLRVGRINYVIGKLRTRGQGDKVTWSLEDSTTESLAVHGRCFEFRSWGSE